jgi:hypothetical protein
MPQHDFSELYARYPDIIAQMPPVFTSHEFILELARQNQRLYVEALHSYRAGGEPFRVVHALLAAHLKELAHLLRMKAADVPSRNILGRMDTCAQWEKLPYRAPHGGS